MSSNPPAAAVPETEKENTGRIILIGGLVVIAAAIFCYVVAHETMADRTAVAGSASALALITGAAVAIERVIEAFWTVIGGTWGTYWPLNFVQRQAGRIEDSLTASLAPLQVRAAEALEKVDEGVNQAQKQLPRLQEEINAIQRQIGELKGMAPGSQRFQVIAAAASHHVNRIQSAYGAIDPALDRELQLAATTIDGLQSFIGSFKDNPGRRLMSILIGATIGLIAAGVLGLDVFQAVLGGAASQGHVVVTGLIIGLGSSPTHEVVRAIQEYKKSRKQDNTPRPDPSSLLAVNQAALLVANQAALLAASQAVNQAAVHAGTGAARAP